MNDEEDRARSDDAPGTGTVPASDNADSRQEHDDDGEFLDCEWADGCAPMATVGQEVIRMLMDLVNAVESDLFPPARTLTDCRSASVLPYSVMQRAAIQRRRLLDILDVFGVTPVDHVGITVNFSQHSAAQVRNTDDPSLHGIVSACLLTGFIMDDVVLRHAVVEVLQHNPPEQGGEQEKRKEG